MAEKKKKVVFSTKLFPEVIDKIRRVSEKTGLKISGVIENSVNEYEKNPKIPSD